MSSTYRILIVIAAGFALFTSVCVWYVISLIMPGMMDAVPGLVWTGIASFCVKLKILIDQYPILLLAWPVSIGCCGIVCDKKINNIRIAVPLLVLTALIFHALLFAMFVGTYAMQDQMIAGMGLPK